MSKTLQVFTDYMAKKAKHFTYMSRSPNEEENIKSELFQVAGFPDVIGCIDGTHIPIIAPPIDECAYVNRKKFHSINVQAVCDANMIFLDVVAKWPGSHLYCKHQLYMKSLNEIASSMVGYSEIAITL